MDERVIARFFQEHREKFLEDIMTLVRIPSISAPGGGQYPFGEGCARVLDAALAMGERMGFEAENHEYRCGSILMPGTEKGEVGMFAHLDVVPPGDGWKNPPCSPYIKDGWLYGRGSCDNKGPAVTALYAMLFLREMGFKPRRTIRLFLGCSEEKGMGDIVWYLKHYPAPDFSFTPDGAFSVCYSEKGIMEAEFEAPLPGEIVRFSAGAASNSVAASAFALLRTEAKRETEACEIWPGISVKREGDFLRVEAAGKSAHAAFPEGSENAAVMLADYICRRNLVSEEAGKILFFIGDSLKDYYGSGLGIAHEDEELGKLTVIAGMTETGEGRLRQNINIRYPACADAGQMEAALKQAANSCGWRMSSVSNDPPSYVSPDSPFVRTLCRACTDRLGPSFVPYTMGGGTYARKIPGAVAFGPGIRGQKKPGPDGHGGGHQPDECVQLKVLEDALHIYIQALEEVDRL